MSPSAQQVARLLVAIPYLQAHQGIGLDEAAQAPGTASCSMICRWPCSVGCLAVCRET